MCFLTRKIEVIELLVDGVEARHLLTPTQTAKVWQLDFPMGTSGAA